MVIMLLNKAYQPHMRYLPNKRDALEAHMH